MGIMSCLAWLSPPAQAHEVPSEGLAVTRLRYWPGQSAGSVPRQAGQFYLVANFAHDLLAEVKHSVRAGSEGFTLQWHIIRPRLPVSFLRCRELPWSSAA
jgi:hypothetical protein